MAIYSVNISNIQRSSGENSVKSAAYISGSKLTLKTIDAFTNIESKKTWDFNNKQGVTYSTILAPDGSPSWAFDREQLWNKTENFEIATDARTGRRLMVALPRELTQEQNIELAREFALYLVGHGMVIDLNIHYDNEHNPHMHLQMTTRELVTNSATGEISFSLVKNRDWGKKFFLNYLRDGISTVINKHLEFHGSLDRVSHLSHFDRGIELIPGIHEGVSRHMSATERHELNGAILAKNAAAIFDNPELVFHKLSINKPVFTKDDIAIVLSDALYIDMNVDSDECESLNIQYSTEFMIAYEKLLQSPEIKLINPCDLKGRTLYALTTRVELEERFISTVAELGSSNNHNLGIKASDIEKLSTYEWISAKVKDLGKVVGLSTNSTSHTFTSAQKEAIVSIVNSSDISLLEGFPGSGKTHVMREIVRQYKKAGYRLIGTATSASASEVLAVEAGVESKNISRLRKVWQMTKNPELDFALFLRTCYYKEDQYRKFGSSLTNKDVLIIDEASMVDLSNMDYLLSEVKAAGAKVILVGDNNQLAAIGMLGAFKKASQIISSVKLTEVMRHKSSDASVTLKYREATTLLGHYKVSEALDIYENLGVFSIHKTKEDTKDSLVKDYVSHYIDLAKHLSQDNLSATKSLVIGAYTNTAVNYFNSEVRQQLKQAGVLKGRNYNYRSGNETIELTKGEQIVFLENKPKFQKYYGVLNGEVGTVLSFTEYPDEFGRGAFKVLVHKADGSKRVVTISTKENIFPARFKHGYAVTAYKLQGATTSHMMVYYEQVVGYEAFNVLMTRHRESVRLYAAEDILEDAVYSKIYGDITEVKEKYDIEGYKISDAGSLNNASKSIQTNKTKIPVWRLGLSTLLSRRVDSSFSIDYAAKNTLSQNEQAIKSYIESRELTFALRAKLEAWKERVFNNKVHAKLGFKKEDYDPYTLLQSSDHVILDNLSAVSKEELQATLDELRRAKDSLNTYAKLTYNNYNKSADENRGNGLLVSDLLTQIGINYETLQRHAGYSNYGYYFKERLEAENTIAANPHFISIIKLFDTIASSSDNHNNNNNNTIINENILQAITDIQNNHEILTEYIEGTKLKLLKIKEELSNLQTKEKSVKDEIERLATLTTKLFPEYLYRIYKENPEDVIAKWDRLVEENGFDNALISNLATRIRNNPKLLGKLRGIGFSDTLGITDERQDAIANLTVISNRLKEYELGKRRLAELNEYITSSKYSEIQVLHGTKIKETAELERSLPSKDFNQILSELSSVLVESSNSQGILTLHDKLKSLASQDEVQGLIYEYYNNSTSKLNTSDTTSQKSYRKTNSQNYKLTFSKINALLTQTHFEQIFRELSSKINDDAPKIASSGGWITCGSLGMNLKNGTWKRFSTNESGNVYSFVSLATGCSKSEALRLLANKVGFNHEYNARSSDYAHKQTTNKAILAKQANNITTNKWVSLSIVPQEARLVDPKKDFPWILKGHNVGSIHSYKNSEGELIGATVRLVNKATKQKQVLPCTYCKNNATNQSAWRFKGFTDNGYKPIYGAEKLNHDKRTILICEGEKTADRAQKLFPEYIVMSWLGGSSNADKVNWSLLKDRKIVIFPDNDLPGKSAAHKGTVAR